MWSAKNPSSARSGTRSRPASATGLPLRRAARHREDVARPHPREGAELRARPDADPGQDLPRVPGDRRRHLARRVEMDAASQRGIDDIREIRERVVLQPVEGRYKVYILDEAHQLTDAAFNALLKLIEEPPPHLVFVFCTTELQKMLPTVRSRCQTFVLSRPRLPEIVRYPKASPRARASRRRRPRSR